MTETSNTHAQKLPASFLDKLIVDLFQRLLIPFQERPKYIGKLFILEHADDINLVFNDPKSFEKDFALVAAVGQSRFNMNGSEWVKLRAKTQREYAKAGRPIKLNSYGEIYAQELLNIDVLDHNTMEQAITRSALRCFFSIFGIKENVSPYLEHFKNLRKMAETLQYQSWVKGRLSADYIKNTESELSTLKLSIWEDFKSNPAILSTIKKFANSGDKFDFETVQTDFLTNMFAGIETTTASLMWMIDSLSRNSDMQTALLTDLENDDQTRIDGFKNETMRFFPPIPFVVRKLTRPVEFSGVQLIAGDSVLLSLIGMHRDPNYWLEPHEFHAARPEFKNDSSAFKPFLSGPRACGGRRIAEMEINVALRILLRNFIFKNTGPETGFQYSLAFRPIFTNDLKIKKRINIEVS